MALGGRWSCLVLVAAAALVPSLPVLQGDFVADDFGCLRLWGEKPFREFIAFGDISDGIWGIPIDEPRPVDALSFRLGYLLSGASPFGHLALALAIHIGCALLVYATTRRAAPQAPRRAALAAGVLFAVHPVHAEAIAWVTGKVDSLATAFYLAGLVLFLRWRERGGGVVYAAALVAFALGLLTKEILLTLPAILLGGTLAIGDAGLGRRLRRGLDAVPGLLPFILLAALYLLGRRWAFGSFAREQRLGSGLRGLLLERQGFAAGELFSPLAAGGLWLLTAAVLVALGLLIQEGSSLRSLAGPLGFFGLVFYFATTAPLALTYFSARHLYLPSVGLAVAAGLALFPTRRFAALRLLTLLTVGLALGTGLVQRQRQWIDAGRASRELRAAIEKQTRDLPWGATVFLSGVPAASGEALFWRAALPFALEPPFVARDVAGSLQLIEGPDLHCCPVAQWWSSRGPALLGLLGGPPEEPVRLHALEWRPGTHRLVRYDATLSRGALRERLERDGIDPFAGPPSHREGGRLVAAFAEAVRVSALRAAAKGA